MPSIETLLNAMCETYHADEFDDYEKASRQYRAFRTRILRMYRKRDEQASKSFELWCTERGITNDLRRQLKEKDQRTADTIAFAKDRMKETTCDWEYGSLEEVVKMLGGSDA